MSGEVACELINVLLVMLGVESHLAAMRERASVNNAAMRVVSIVYPNVVDVGCFYHTLDIVGEKFKTPVLLYNVALFSHSPRRKKPFGNSKQEKLWPSYSKIHWWSQWEVLHQLMEQFGNIEKKQG